MTNRIAITVSKQGAEDTTAKTQTKSGSKGFLGMLMTAIGHQRKIKFAKGAQSEAAPVTNISTKNTARNAASETGVAGKSIAVSKDGAPKNESSDLATKLAMPDNRLAISSGRHKATTKGIAGDRHKSAANTASNNSNAGTANQHADIKDTRHRSDTWTKSKDETGTAMDETVIAIVSQASPPTVPSVQPGSNKNASTTKGAEHYSNAHLHPVRPGTLPAQAGQRQSTTGEHIPEKATAKHHGVNTPRPHTGQTHVSKDASPSTEADAGLAMTNSQTPIGDGKIVPRTQQDANTDTNIATTDGKGNIDADTASAPSSQRAASAGTSEVPVAEATATPDVPTGLSMAAPGPQPGHQQSDGNRPSPAAISSHPADRGLSQSTHVSGDTSPRTRADVADMAAREAADISMPHSRDNAKYTSSTDTHAHADNNHPSNIPIAGTKTSQEGIRSYGRLSANARGPSTLAKATSRISKPLHGSHAGSPSSAPTAPGGQNAGMGHMPLASAAAAGSQAASNAHITPPPQAMHASGPWTVMAAMQEIGQAAVNGHSRLELKLEPAHLGKVHVRIDSDAGKNIRVHLVVEQATSRQIIEHHLPNLRHALAQQGLNLGDFSMSSQQQGAGNGYAPDQHAQQPVPMHVASPSETMTPLPVNTTTVRAGSGRLSIRI